MLTVNFFAGPGTGKSTHAAMLFALLKSENYNAELVQEYAKEKTWLRDAKTLEVQPYIAGKQFFRQAKLRHDLDIIVTDSPLIQGLAYSGYGFTPSFGLWLVEAFHLFDNLNIFLERDTEHHTFNPKGRWQDEAASIEKDKEILAILENNNIEFTKIKVGPNSHQDVFKFVKNVLDTREGWLLKDVVLAELDKPNQNGKVYPKESYETSMKWIKQAAKEGQLSGQIDHPVDGDFLLKEVSHLITSVNLTDNLITGDVQILKTNRGYDIHHLMQKFGADSIEFRPRMLQDGTLLSFDMFAKQEAII